MDTNKKLLAIATKLAGLASGLDNCNSSAEQQAADLANDAKKLLADTPLAHSGFLPQHKAMGEKNLKEMLATHPTPMAALVADWRDQAKRLRNEVPNLRDGSDKRFDSARDADMAADELEAALAATPSAQAGEVEPFGHYFRDVEGMDRFHRGPRAPGFAQSDITPLYTTLPQPQGDASREAYVPASPDSFDSHHNTASPQVSGASGLSEARAEVMRAILKWMECGIEDRKAAAGVDDAVEALEAAVLADAHPAPQARPDAAEMLGGPNCKRVGDYIVNIDGNSIVVSQGRRLVIAHTDSPAPTADGGDFYDILYGAKITLILNAGDDASGEVPLTVGATVGAESDLTILCHAEKDGKPITLSVDPQADVARLVEAAKDARFALYGNGPGNPALDAALAPFTAAPQVES